MQTQTNDYGVTEEGDAPGLDLKDTGGSGANFRLESDGGNLELHSGYGGSSTKMDSLNYRYVEVRIPADGAASDTWGENGEGYAVFYVPPGVYYTVTGITLAVDDDFGGDTNYATISMDNKSTDGSGTIELASKAFTSVNAVNHFDATTLGSISNADISAGEVLALQKTVTADGEIFPGGVLILTLQLRTA